MNSNNLIITQSQGAITRLILNRPEKRNALSVALMESLTAAILETENQPDARVILLTHRGPAFCAGLDLAEHSDADLPARALRALYETIALSPLPIIALADGPAIGGGAGLIAASDLAIVSDKFQLGFPEVRRGLVAALVTTLLRRQLSERPLRELTLLGQTIPAARALHLGLINKLVPTSDLEVTAAACANEIIAGAPNAIARTKYLLAQGLVQQLGEALELHLAAKNSPEAAEGVAAFNEKRPPRWPTRT